MTFSVQRLPEPLLLEQAVLDPTWNTFKTMMVFLGGILFLAFLGGGMFFLGRSQAVSISEPAIIERVIERPEPAPAPIPREPTPEEKAEQFKEELRHQYGVR